MNVSGMLADLNQEIARLTRIVDLLGEIGPPATPGPGRPRSSGKQTGEARSSQPSPERRSMSAEARERIAAAQRKRWAKSAGKKARTVVPKPGIVKTIRAVPAKEASGKTAPAKKTASKRVARGE